MKKTLISLLLVVALLFGVFAPAGQGCRVLGDGHILLGTQVGAAHGHSPDQGLTWKLWRRRLAWHG